MSKNLTKLLFLGIKPSSGNLWPTYTKKFAKAFLENASFIEIVVHEYIDEKDLHVGEAYLHFDSNGLQNLRINNISQPVAFSKYLVEQRYARNVGRKAHDIDEDDDFSFDFDCNGKSFYDDDSQPGQFSDADEDVNENVKAKKVEASQRAESFDTGVSIRDNVKDFLQKRKTRKPVKTTETASITSEKGSIPGKSNQIDPAKSNIKFKNSFYRSIQASNVKANEQGTSIPDKHKQFLANRKNKKQETSKADIFSETSSTKSKMTANESFPISSSKSEKSEVSSQNHSALASEDHQFLIVHKDLSARKCKPIVKLSDLDQLHPEYYRHVSYNMKLGYPKHEIHKGMYDIQIKSKHNLHNYLTI